MRCFFFVFRCIFFLYVFNFPLTIKCYLKIYFFWTCWCTVSKWGECGFGLNKIGSRLQGNRRWQPVVLVEEELYYLSISAVIFSKHIWILYNHRKDVRYFHQKNCRRNKMMLQKAQRQKVFHWDKKLCLISYIETILNTCLW